MIYYILFCVIIACLVGYIIHLRHHKLEIISVNQEAQKLNNEIAEEIKLKQQELQNIKVTVEVQNNIVRSLTDTAARLRENAEQQAQRDYEAKKTVLEARLEEEKASLSANIEKEIAAIVARKEKESLQLQDLKDKQLAYIEAQQRQEEINQKQDYYRLVLSSTDINDITLLRELQLRFTKKEAVDKLIWETYYKTAYDLLMSHLFASNEKVSGIYKITDTITGLAYIGQSVDIKERFRQHIKSSLAYGGATNKLYQTMQKSGQYNFTFEILEQVSRDKLNERETYWIDFYKTKEYGLNSTRGGS